MAERVAIKTMLNNFATAAPLPRTARQLERRLSDGTTRRPDQLRRRMTPCAQASFDPADRN